MSAGSPSWCAGMGPAAHVRLGRIRGSRHAQHSEEGGCRWCVLAEIVVAVEFRGKVKKVKKVKDGKFEVRLNFGARRKEGDWGGVHLPCAAQLVFGGVRRREGSGSVGKEQPSAIPEAATTRGKVLPGAASPGFSGYYAYVSYRWAVPVTCPVQVFVSGRFSGLFSGPGSLASTFHPSVWFWSTVPRPE